MRTNSGQAGNENVTVLYEDEALLVCIKPRGVRSAQDASGKRSMNDLLSPRTIYPVHRLDLEVSGLMVFAKTQKAAAFLSAAMGDDFVKEYLALCEACPAPLSGELTDLLFHDRVKNKTYVVERRRNGVKEARLAYQVLERREDGGALVQIRLYTGRTHQIRVQFASRCCPLRGDKKYGAQSSGPICLISWRLTFPHPNGRIMTFTHPNPAL